MKNEKRTLITNEKKLEEVQEGLCVIESEIEKSNQHLEQIRDLNKNIKTKVEQVENSILISQSETPQSEEI